MVRKNRGNFSSINVSMPNEMLESYKQVKTSSGVTVSFQIIQQLAERQRLIEENKKLREIISKIRELI